VPSGKGSTDGGVKSQNFRASDRKARKWKDVEKGAAAGIDESRTQTKRKDTVEKGENAKDQELSNRKERPGGINRV